MKKDTVLVRAVKPIHYLGKLWARGEEFVYEYAYNKAGKKLSLPSALELASAPPSPEVSLPLKNAEAKANARAEAQKGR